MRRFFQFTLFFLISVNCLTQEAFPAPDPFTQSANQLIQSATGTSSRINAFHSEFDSLGNRLSPLSGASFIAPVNFETDYSSEDLGTDLGQEYGMRYTPILAINGNPYALKPAVDVLQKLGPFDVQKPDVTYILKHDSGLVSQLAGLPISAFSQILTGDIIIRTSTERAGRFTAAIGYRPAIVRFFEYPDLNSIDHRAFIQMALALQKIDLTYGGRVSLANLPGTLTGARSKSEVIQQAFQISYEINPKLTSRLKAQLNSSEQSESIVEELGGGQQGGTTTQYLNSTVTYTPIEKISISSELGFRNTQQDVGAIGKEKIGGNRSTIPIGIGLAYAKSEKLQISLGTGVRFNSDGPADDFYDISADFELPRDIRFTASVGSSTEIGAGSFGFEQKRDYMRALMRKRIFRRTIISAAANISSLSIATQNALASALGTSERTLYSISSTTPIGEKTTIVLSYTILDVTSATALLSQANTTTSIKLTYRF